MSTRYLFSNLFFSLRKRNFSYTVKTAMADDRDGIRAILARIETIKKQLLALTDEVGQVQTALIKVQSKSRSASSLLNKNFSTSVSSKRKITNAEDPFDTNNSPLGNNMKKTKTDFDTDSDGYVIVYTDGACENNGKANAKAGYGVWFGENHPLNVSEPVKGRATNNCGEIQACTAAINAAQEAYINKLHIHTDSQFVINSMTKWIHGWKKNGWKTADGKPVKNKDDFVDLTQALEGLSDIKWKYVPGHSKIEGNESADLLARQGAARYKK